MKKIIAKFGVPVIAALMAAQVDATTVNMSLINSFSHAETGFTASINGASSLVGNDLIGIYSFTINSINPHDVTITSPFYTMCISPSGSLNFGNFDYTLQTFGQAAPGLNPNLWAHPNAVDGGIGIQNANYIFTKFAPTLYGGGTIGGQAGTGQQQAAAMALAVYTALYNSSAYGVAANGNASVTGGFDVTSGLSGDVLFDYNYDLGLNGLAAYKGVPLDTGYVLTPTLQTSQAMILIGNGLPQGSPVPESSTIIAGALLLLPFGASTLRIMRRNRVA